jgi:hypothetical protein
MKLQLATTLLACFLLTSAVAGNSPDSKIRTAPAAQSVVFPSFTVRRTAAEVLLVLTVNDRFHGPVHGLNASDFRVLDGNQVVRKFMAFEESSDLPLCVGVLIDLSDSVEERISLEHRTAHDFLGHILRTDADDGFLVGFAREVSPAQRYPAISPAALIVGSAPQGIGTSLFDAVVKGIERAKNTPTELARRVLIVLSDGEDTLSMHTESAAIEAAQRAGVVVYSIALRSGRGNGGEEVLRRIALQTGGLAFTAENIDALTSTFQQIEHELRSQYLLTYKPPAAAANTGKYRKIHVLWNGNRHEHIRARAGYFVEAE